MTYTTKTLALAAFAIGGIALAPASAQNPGFAPGDLVLGFQSTGANSESYIVANLGQSGLLRDTTGTVSLLNLGSTLTAQYGASWFERPDLYVALFAIGSNDEFNGYFVNGDPDLTPYVGVPRQSVGVAGMPGSFAPSLTGAQVQQASNGMFSAQDVFETAGLSGVATISKTMNLTDYDDQNPISGGVQGAAFQGVFPAGVQAVFGPGAFGNIGGINAEAALDFYRVQGFNNIPGQFGFGQPTGEGTFHGTVLINDVGQVSLVGVPEPTTFGLLSMGAALVGFSRRRRAVIA